MVARADFCSGFSQTCRDFEQTRCFRRNPGIRRYNALKAQGITKGFKHFPDEEGTESAQNPTPVVLSGNHRASALGRPTCHERTRTCATPIASISSVNRSSMPHFTTSVCLAGRKRSSSLATPHPHTFPTSLQKASAKSIVLMVLDSQFAASADLGIIFLGVRAGRRQSAVTDR